MVVCNKNPGLYVLDVQKPGYLFTSGFPTLL